MVKTTLNPHLNQVRYSTLASAKPPIIDPQVGVIKLTNPLAATKIIIVTEAFKLIPSATGATIGVDKVARPELEGTKIDNRICKINSMEQIHERSPSKAVTFYRLQNLLNQLIP